MKSLSVLRRYVRGIASQFSRQEHTLNLAAEKDLQQFAARKRTGVSLRSLLETGKGELLNKHIIEQCGDESAKEASSRVQIQVACFLHHELPVRFAHRVTRLESSGILSQSGKVIS